MTEDFDEEVVFEVSIWTCLFIVLGIEVLGHGFLNALTLRE